MSSPFPMTPFPEPPATAHGCAVRMADGRLFTDYRPRCDVASQFAQMPPSNGSYEYRQWLIHNGQRVMDWHRAMAVESARCSSCTKVPTMPLEKEMFVCTPGGCSRQPNQFRTTTDRVRSFGTGRHNT